MADVVKLPELTDEFEKKQSMSFNSKLIDALLDIRLTLSIKKLSSNFILKSEFKSILDATKVSVKDQAVSDALDDVFSEYFKKDVAKDNKSSALSIGDMEKIINDNINYGEEKTQTGISYVKTDAHHKPSFETENKAA